MGALAAFLQAGQTDSRLSTFRILTSTDNWIRSMVAPSFITLSRTDAFGYISAPIRTFLPPKDCLRVRSPILPGWPGSTAWAPRALFLPLNKIAVSPRNSDAFTDLHQASV